ncbi:MAG: hypothetical protein IKB08_07290 [Clostridia bacterium]|nr:hypothetical protein [Clostridia bacterium]
MKNNSSKSRFTRITAKAFVMLLAVVLSLSVLPTLSADILPTAYAAEKYTVAAGTTVSAINSQLASYPEGTVVDVTFTTSIDFTNTSTATFDSGITGIIVPSGITVNLFLNGNTIKFERTSGGAWQLPYVYAIHNKGTLNIYSGSSATATSSTAKISVINVRTGMSPDEEHELSYCALEAVHNEGALTINNKVAIDVTSQLHYDKINTGGSLTTRDSSQVASGAAAVNNVNTNSSCYVDGATFNVVSFAEGTFSSNYNGASYADSVAFAYGIYGGNVSVAGGSKINVTSNGNCSRDTHMGSKSDGKAWLTSVAMGIATSGTVNVSGADITHEANITNSDAATNDGGGRQDLYSGGIFTLSGNKPVAPDATITTPDEDCMNNSDGTVTYRKGAVLACDEMLRSSTDVVTYMMSFRNHHVQGPAKEVKVGNFYDEAGNSYVADMKTGVNEIPVAMNRGAMGSMNRVHIVYRYWVDKNRSAIDTSIVGSDGNVGYSYKPLADGTNVVDTLVTLSGVTGKNILTKNPDSAIKYLAGGASCNSYYWGLIDVAYKTTSDYFSDYDVTSTANRGDSFKTFTAQGATDSAAPASNGPIYIFVDYARIDPTAIKAKVGTSNIVNTTYTGYPIKASDIGLKILDSIYETDYTSEYNVDFADSDLINITYSYEGKNAAGVTETSESGQLPTNAGSYDVVLKVNQSTTYDKDPKHNKNRYGLEYKFTLVIEQAYALRGNLPESLPESIEFEYGKKLNEVLVLSDYVAQGIANDTAVEGVFSFTNASDGSVFKNAGNNQTVSVTWTPTQRATNLAWNYKATQFNVTFSVRKAPLTIKPNAAAVIYGEEEFTTPYSVTITGLVANDTGDSVKNDIFKALSFMVQTGDSYVPYVAGEVSVGTYYIRATFSDVPAVLSNYEYEYVYGAGANEEGVLRVSQRALKVEATAQDRAYAPDNYNVNVTFTITDGRFGVDDVRILAATGGLTDNTAGVREVNGITKQSVADLVTGGAGKNYYVADVTYKSGTKLLVTINKGIPTVTTPVVEEMFYQRARTLKDIELTGYTSSVEGTWQWVNDTINPTVKVGTYKAQYVPQDLNNYEVKVVDIAVKVKATPVVISYTGAVSYGDNIPNITAYTYKADLDPTFNIDAVTTSGNITPRTAYVKGSPVVEGGYTVEISAPNFVDVNGNYIFSTQNGVITVSPRLITFKVEDATATYGDNFVPSASTVKVSFDEALLVGTDTIEDVTANGDAPTFEYSTDFRYIDNYQVGTYYIKATPNFITSPNYEVAATQGTLKVTKAQLVIKADDITLEYGSPIPADIENAFTVVGAKRNETAEEVVSSGAIKIDTTYEKNSPVNTDGYPITVDVLNATFNNYTVTVQHGVITVIKATPKVVTLPTATIIHGQTLGDAVFAGGSVENGVAGKYLYNASTTTPAYRSEPYTIYTATFVPADTVNYNSVSGLYVALTVGKKPVSGTLAVTGVPMVGQKLTVDVTGLDPDELGVYTLTWYASGVQVGTGAELLLDEAHKLQSLTVKAVANAPYTGEVTYVTTVIAPSLTSVETILTAEKYETYFNLSGLSEYNGEAEYRYNAQPHYVEFQRDNTSLSSASIGAVTIKYNGSTIAPTTVGYYTVTIDIATPTDVDLTKVKFVDGVSMVDGKAVYSPVANYKIGTLIITKAPYYVTVVVNDKVYDGTGTATAKVTDQYGACELTDGTLDKVSFDEESAVYYFASSNVGTDIDVFVNNAVLKGEAAENYELSITIDNSSKADITKRTLKVKVVPVEREYEVNNYYVDLSFEPVANTLAAGDDGFVYVDEGLVQGAIDNYRAGIRNVTVSGAVLTGSKAANYDLELVNLDGLTVEILKATPSYPIPMTDVLYYDSARPLNAISLGDNRWTWDSEVANEVPGAGVHTFTAVYTPDDTANFATVEYEVELEILKTVVTITAANFTVTYGDTEPTYYYNVSGLTGADTIKTSVDGYVLMNCSYQAGSDVGKYDIVLTGAFESDNYDFIYKNGVVTVNKRAAYVEAIALDREYEPGNLNVDVTFSEITNLYGSDGADDVFLEGTFPLKGTVENENAGIKTVKYTLPALAGAKAGNYELRLLNPTLTVEILKAKIQGVTLPVTGVVGYGQKLSTVTFTSSYEGTEFGTFSMENPTMTPTEVGTFADVYKVVFTPFNTQNYATITQYITLTVQPSELNVAIAFTGTAQVGKSLYVLVNDLPADASKYLFFEWYRVDNFDADIREGYKVASGVDAYTLTEADGGKYIICTVTNIDGAPYTCFAECRTDSAIEEQVLSFWQRLVNWFYRIISNITQIFGKIM